MLRGKHGCVMALIGAFAVASAFQTQSSTYFSNAFSQDGTKVITSDWGRVAIWDVATGKKIAEPVGASFQLKGAVISPDGNYALSQYKSVVVLTNLQTGLKSTILFEEQDEIWCAAFSPDSTKILTSTLLKSVMVFDVKSLTPKVRLFNDHNHRIYVSAQFSADGTKILTADFRGTVRIWEALSGNELASYLTNCGRVRHVSYSPDESKILVGASKDVALLLDARTGKELRSFRWSYHQIISASFSPDQTHLVAGGYEANGPPSDIGSPSTDRTIRVWDVKTGRVVMDLKGQKGEIQNVSYSPDGTKIFGDGPKFAGIWDAKTGQLLMTLK